MKKAKRLLAVLLAAVMIFSVAAVPSYAYKAESDNWHVPKVNGLGKYYFTYDQACGYVLDLVDQLLAKASLKMTCDELNDMVNIGLNVFTSNMLLNLDDYIKNDGGEKGVLNFTTLDDAVRTLYSCIRCIRDNGLVAALDAFGGLGDLRDGTIGLTAVNFNKSISRATNKDSEVLGMLVEWLYGERNFLRALLAGGYNFGLLDGTLNGLIQKSLGLPNSSFADVTGLVKDAIYVKLIDSTATQMPAGMTIDDAVQKLVNWALIEGTGVSAETGAFSVLGDGAEPLLPSLGDQPGGASLYGDTIQADRDLDGVPETCTMNFYQLVYNAIRAALDTLVVPMVADLLYDALDVEITEQYPGGDPAILQDTMFVTIVGAVEGLATSNGAPEPVYTDEDNATPVAKINAMLKWFFNDGGLDTFIKIDYQGIHLTDNFMSLLNDVARLAINLLPGLGLFANSMDLAYTADDLNLVWYHDADMNLVDSTSETAVDQTYTTYETGAVIYPSAKQTIDNVTTITAYCYLDSQQSVNTTDPSAADYVNPDLIRPNYVISTDKVYACLVKMLLDDKVDGCYFPEWTEDIPSVLAYGFASLVAPDLPENDYFTRLDAYHELMVTGAPAAYDANGNEIDALPYTITKTVDGVTATIPKAALDIIASWGAATINSYFPIGMETNTTFEQFAGEFLLWGVIEYAPILAGTEDSATGTMTGSGVWKDVLNVYINAVYSDFSSRKYKANANFDAVYDLVDDTIFTLIPASWIPGCSGSFDLVNSMLFETISNFDLQGILGILSINTSPDAELALPVVTVLLRIIDRVLAIVFNDNGILLPEGRVHVTRDQKLTNITTLGAFLDCTGTAASVPTLLYNIIDNFHTYQAEILGTVLPLIVAQSYQRPYDEAYLGSKGITTYKIADLDNYVKYFKDNVNAEAIKSFDNVADAKAAVDGKSQAVKTLDGSKYELRLSNGTVYGTYATLEETMTVQETLKNAYYVEDVVDETTTNYIIYARKSYMTSAAATPANDADGATWGEYNTYSGFTKASLTNRTEANPFVSYDSFYRYYGYEDFGSASYVYRNVKTAAKDAQTFSSTYNSFATTDLPAAYHEWMMFSINGRLKANDLYDANDDGRSVLSNTDTDYVAATTDATTGEVTDPGYPVDGTPGVPEAMYPFSTTDATAFTYYDKKIGENITVYMNSFTSAGFEQLALALEYANDPLNDVTLSVRETEALVRLAINTVNFDITPKTRDDGTEYYNEGSIQWDGLTENQKFLIDSFCSSNGYTHETVTADDGTVSHVIKHKAFALLDSSLSFGFTDLSSTPVADVSSIKAKTMNQKTDADERILTVHTAYADYVDALTANRRSLYNKIDYISYRYEVAEANRSKAVDTTMLSWALNHYADIYKNSESGLRNLKYTGNVDETTGQAERIKIYTTTSYAKFRNAYDFAQSLFDAAKSSVQAEGGLTQSLVTAAYKGIIDACRQLKPFEGFADWTQLDAYIALAEEILRDPNKDDPVLGYESGLDVLQTSLDNALYLKSNKENIDSERQSEIDANAGALKQAIGLLVYKSVPQVLPSTSGQTEGISTVQIKNENNDILGHIIGLTEGVGINEAFNEDLITIVGMREDSGSGTEVVKARSGHGYGTGAYYSGKVENQERFRYYAVLYGDINGDTRIDGTDASALELYILQGKNNTSGMGYAKSEAGDINRDGEVDPQDVQGVIDHYTLKETIDQKAHSSSKLI